MRKYIDAGRVDPITESAKPISTNDVYYLPRRMLYRKIGHKNNSKHQHVGIKSTLAQTAP